MHNANIPDYAELPSTSKLIKSTIIAVIAAAVILVTIVLPAEFGIDPTGLGKLTGLQRMGEIKVALADEAAENEAETNGEQAADLPIIESESKTKTDEMSVTLDPNKSTEIKITMAKGTSVEFSWSTSSGEAFYDLHGDSNEVNYHIYEKGTEATMEGTFEAAFDGNHGWYWKNRTDAPITITLNTTGQYQRIKEMN